MSIILSYSLGLAKYFLLLIVFKIRLRFEMRYEIEMIKSDIILSLSQAEFRNRMSVGTDVYFV